MKYAKKFISAFLLLAIVVAIIPTAVLAADTVTIKIRVFDQTTGQAYDVGTDVADKADRGVQSEPYTIRPLSDFTKSTWKTIAKVSGNWYFPTGDRNVGSIVYFSNNSDTATITYWVTEYKPYTEPETLPGETTPPSENPGEIQNGTAGDAKNVWLYIQVVYADYNKTSYKYGEKIKVYLDCQSSYCKHTQNCSIRLKDFHPTAISLTETMNGCKWIGWSKYSVNLTPQFGTFYDWNTDKTNLTNPSGNVFYLIYQNTTPPSSGESGSEASPITLTFHDDTETTTQTGLSGDPFIMPSALRENAGYVFMGWSTTENASEPEYTAAQQVVFNADTDLYAVWKKNVTTVPWEISFEPGLTDVNVTGMPETQYAACVDNAATVTVPLPAQEPSAEKMYAFQGWSVEGDNSGKVYSAGESITLNSDKTVLVAQWNLLDISGNGTLDIEDVKTTMDYLTGNITLTAEQLAAADFNGDGNVDYLDAMAIKEYLVAQKNP